MPSLGVSYMQSPRPRSFAFGGPAIAGVILSGALSACSGSTQSFAPSGSAANSTAGQSAQAATDAWRRSLARNPLPASGCFQASFPSAVWKRVACSVPPHLLYPVPPSRRTMEAFAQSVGNGADYTANATPNFISTAVGAFPQVTGVKKVKSVTNPIFGGGGENGPNSYTLQLNSYFFSTSACGTIQNCDGWEQFVYENPPGKSKGELFIQDWLIPTGRSGLSGCPPGKGWEFADGGCVQNSPTAVTLPNESITNLGQFTETGAAASSGDSIFLSVGTTEYGMKNIQGDGITDLSAHWQGAEFNVIGNAGGDIANFNKGSTITVSLQADTGLTTAPGCPANSGTTGESNNLSFVAAPSNPPELQYPSIEFTMSNATKGSASCDTVQGI
jgi:hypothetical protein